MKKLTQYEKILQVLDAKGIKISKAEAMMGVGTGTMSKLKERAEGKGKMHPDNVDKFLRTFHVNHNWWENGDGQMFDDEPQEKSNDELSLIYIQTIKELVADKNKEIAWLRSLVDNLTSQISLVQNVQK